MLNTFPPIKWSVISLRCLLRRNLLIISTGNWVSTELCGGLQYFLRRIVVSQNAQSHNQQWGDCTTLYILLINKDSEHSLDDVWNSKLDSLDISFTYFTFLAEEKFHFMILITTCHIVSSTQLFNWTAVPNEKFLFNVLSTRATTRHVYTFTLYALNKICASGPERSTLVVYVGHMNYTLAVSYRMCKKVLQ